MFKELIEEIGDMPIEYVGLWGYHEGNIKRAYQEAWQRAIEKAIGIIESDKPKWVDKPEPNGWYWIRDFCNMDIQCVHVFETKFRGSLGGRFDIGDYKGKWIKAIVPEME